MVELKNIDLFLIDMDGTIYIEDKLIDGAYDFIMDLIKHKKNYVFLTNNSSVNKNTYIDKMKFLNIPCGEDNLFSSGMAMGMFLSEERKDKKVFLVGTKDLSLELKAYNIIETDDNPDIVVVGFDRELNYQKLEKACYFLDNGSEFLATNPDLVYPIKGSRYIPDCGSICHMLTTSTKKEPMYIGKPNRFMIDLMAKKYQISHKKIAIIGDRLYTDIAAGKNACITTICVLSGETRQEMIQESLFQPNYVFKSVKEIKII